MSSRLTPGWFKEQVALAQADVAKWPDWLKRSYEAAKAEQPVSEKENKIVAGLRDALAGKGKTTRYVVHNGEVGQVAEQPVGLWQIRDRLQYIVERENFAFAECSEAEAIWAKAKEALIMLDALPKRCACVFNGSHEIIEWCKFHGDLKPRPKREIRSEGND